MKSRDHDTTRAAGRIAWSTGSDTARTAWRGCNHLYATMRTLAHRRGSFRLESFLSHADRAHVSQKDRVCRLPYSKVILASTPTSHSLTFLITIPTSTHFPLHSHPSQPQVPLLAAHLPLGGRARGQVLRGSTGGLPHLAARALSKAVSCCTAHGKAIGHFLLRVFSLFSNLLQPRCGPGHGLCL